MRRFLGLRTLLIALGGWLALTMTVLVWFAQTAAPPNTRAILLMGACLVVIWVGIGGLLMRISRERIRRFVQAISLDWRVKFVLFATGLALLEEAVTVSLTNLAPWFGVPVGAAYITASANYLDVVCCHSVVVFIPMFIGWAWLLQRFAFKPAEVFLLFGVTGLLSEISIGGLQVATAFAMWIYVYGLMVYLPAFSLPPEREARRPAAWHYLLAVWLPFLCAIPVALLVNWLHPTNIHFPPIPPGS